MMLPPSLHERVVQGCRLARAVEEEIEREEQGAGSV